MGSNVIKGPRPISLHFANSQKTWDHAAATGAKALDLDIWNDAVLQQVKGLRKQLAVLGNRDAFETAIKRKAAERKDAFIAGINTYIGRPYSRPNSCSEPAKKIGCVTLHDYGGEGQPILMVPSLVNPYYILDLMPGRSFACYLKEQGYRPFLLDWGSPSEAESGYGLTEYVEARLEPMLQHVTALAGAKIPVIGYCMGGTLCAALVVRNPSLVSKLVLLAAPWNFDTKKPLAGRQNAVEMLELINSLPAGSDVSVDLLQTFFTNVDPTLSDRKFRAYNAGKYRGEEADFFSAMEVWANNGPMLARGAALASLGDWYRDNKPHLGRWLVGGQTILPEGVDCPAFIAAPKADRLVPQESAFAFMEGLRQGVKHEPPSGHIGMVVGNRAKKGLWSPVVDWLRGEDRHAA